MSGQEHQADEFSLKSFFVPLTTLKAIHWIVAIGFIVYGNMLFNGFVWDDKGYIINNVQVHTINLLNSFKESLFNTGGHYRPIPALHFSIMYSLFGSASFFYHFFQLVLHVVNAVLVFIFFKKFISKNLSFLLSLVFLIHPLQVEAVSYIAAIGNPLFVLFGMIALLLSRKTQINKGTFFIISCLLLLSILTRETGFIFFILILIYRFLFEKRQIINFFIVEILITLIYCYLRFSIGKAYFTRLELVPIANVPLVERLINIPAIFFYYIKTFFIPVNLLIDQQWVIQKINFSDFYFPLIINAAFLLLCLLFAFYLYKKNKKNYKIFLFFLSFCLMGFAMHSQIFPLDMTVSDKWFYLVMVGVLGMIGISLQTFEFSTKHKTIFYTTTMCIILVFSIRTIVRNTNWSNPLTLYIHDSKFHNNFDIENNIGSEFTSMNNHDEALKHYKQSVKLLPTDTNLYNLGSTYMQKKEFKKAKEYYSMVINNKHSRSAIKLFTYQKFAWILLSENNPIQAVSVINMGIKDFSNDGTLWTLLAVSNYHLNKEEEALAAAQKARELMPNAQTESIYRKILNKEQLNIF